MLVLQLYTKETREGEHLLHSPSRVELRGIALLYRHALGKVARLVNVATTVDGDASPILTRSNAHPNPHVRKSVFEQTDLLIA